MPSVGRPSRKNALKEVAKIAVGLAKRSVPFAGLNTSD